MILNLIKISCVFSLLLTTLIVKAETTLHHQLKVKLDPENNSLEVIDQITLPAAITAPIQFKLNSNLKLLPSDPQQSLQIKALKPSYYQITLAKGVRSFKLAYQGKINQPLEAYGKEQARGFRSTTGIISSQGVYLAGNSYWYASFSAQERISFTLDIDLPKNWKAVSQGAGTHTNNHSHWHESHPQEEIYLIVAPFHFYQQQTGKIKAQVYLRKADATLANKYLQATEQYLQMYEKLLGNYPYAKFALVENFWETGYGMPSFTLLGSKVIRLPFILNSSYPHEILHNWWGNGVYIDYQSGNWSEGLTAYLADHLIKEQQNKAVAYRQQSLQKYSDYAARGRDFPLAKFYGRHSSATEAVGYGKVLMLFHMLRQNLGDQLFRQGLQAFYQQYQFKQASYTDIRKVFERIAKQPLKDFFSQWVLRTGAPELQLGKTHVEKIKDHYQLSFELVQNQPDKAYQLNIPLSISLKDNKNAYQQRVLMSQKKQVFTFNLPSKPLRLDIDPEFDLFRKLARAETPPAFSRIFGSQQLLVILPSKAKDKLKTAYQQFAEQMKRMGSDTVTIKWDNELNNLPTGQAISLIGWENRFLPILKAELTPYKVIIKPDSLLIQNKTIVKTNNSVAITVRHQQSPLSFIATNLPKALSGLARKLPHYHKYSYLVFSGEEPQNILKGRWQVTQSPMTAFFTANTVKASLKNRPALIEPPTPFSIKNMQKTIERISKDEFQGRGFGSEGLNKAADFIANNFKTAGLQAGGDTTDSYFQQWQAIGGASQQQSTLKNIIGIIKGNNPKFAGQSVVIGAHYDHLGLGWPDVRANNKGKIHHGADDNASGVAVLLELAQTLGKHFKPERSIIFIAFSGEEAGRLGSQYYLKHAKKYPSEKIIGMLNLDTVGRLGNNKLLVMGANSASEWAHIFRGIGFVTGIQTTLINKELDASDQISFHQAGIPAVQLFSGAHLDYHRPSDSAEKIDYAGLLKVATISKEVIDYLSSRKEPMHVTLKNYSNKEVTQNSNRKVSLGTIPDFTWTGKGYRLAGVVPNSPVAKAGLQQGDVIIKIAKQNINNLRDVSTVLKNLQSGMKITIVYLRTKQTIEKEVILEKK